MYICHIENDNEIYSLTSDMEFISVDKKDCSLVLCTLENIKKSCLIDHE